MHSQRGKCITHRRSYKRERQRTKARVENSREQCVKCVRHITIWMKEMRIELSVSNVTIGIICCVLGWMRTEILM